MLLLFCVTTFIRREVLLGCVTTFIPERCCKPEARFGGRSGAFWWACGRAQRGVRNTAALHQNSRLCCSKSRLPHTSSKYACAEVFLTPKFDFTAVFISHTGHTTPESPSFNTASMARDRTNTDAMRHALAAANVPATCPQPTRNAPSACRSGMNLNAAEFSDYTEQVLCRAVPCLSLLSPSVPRFVPTRHAPRCAAGGRGPLQHVQRVRSRRLRLHLARKSHVNHGGDCPPALEHGTWTFRPANRRADPAVAPCFARRSTWR